ncbi:MAG: hypothetical protein DHS20C08_21470 [Rhodomicrobium sp.]|nr:MAG: hypothetical protein DHS20C08_21470 [Rhodomicrobium sp.]
MQRLQFNSYTFGLLLLSLIALPLSFINAAKHAPKDDKATLLWSYTQFDEPKTGDEPARLTIGLAATKRPLIQASCYLGKRASAIPLTLFTESTKPDSKDAEKEPIPLTFSVGNYEQTYSGKLAANDGSKAMNGDGESKNPHAIAINIKVPLTAEFWNALMATKGLTFQIPGQAAKRFTLVRGSEKRIDSFLANCRSRSVGINPVAMNDTIITRVYRCEDGNRLTVAINVTGTTPSLTYSYKDANEKPLKAEVASTGLLYRDANTSLIMSGETAKLKRGEKQLSCGPDN